jgi:hypothetical protein
MKNLILTFLFLQLAFICKSQEIVTNPRLIARHTVNSSVRSAFTVSQNSMLQDIIEDKEKSLENYSSVLIAKERIFRSITNVQEGFQNSKQLTYIIELVNKSFVEFQKLGNENIVSNPDIILMRSNYIDKYQQDVNKLVVEIYDEVMKADDSYLMDFHERQQALNFIERRVYQLYIRTKALNMMIANYARLSLFKRITSFSSYINRDKRMFEKIMRDIDKL